MNLRRSLLATVALAAVLSLAYTPAAVAARPAGAPQSAPTALSPAGPSAPASTVDSDAIIFADFGTNRNVRLWREYTGRGYRVWAEAVNWDFFGHFHFWGPGLDINVPTSPPYDVLWKVGAETLGYEASGSGWVCVEGWEALGGGRWASQGLPCLPV